jgi:hypothetical protein
MIRNLKALGLALVAVFAFAAITSSAAQATVQFTGYETPGVTHVHTILKGTTENIEPFSETYTTAIGKIHCHVTYEATSLTGIDTELTVKVTKLTKPEETSVEDCITTIGTTKFTTHVRYNGCDYQFTNPKKLKADEYTGTIDVKCPEGKEIEVEITKLNEAVKKCLLKVPGGAKNENLGHIIYRNERKPVGETHVTVESTISKANGKGITYTTEGGILNCGQVDGEHVEGGEYVGKVTLAGFDTAGKPLDIEVSGE